MGKTKRKGDPEQGGRGYKEQIKTEAGLRDWRTKKINARDKENESKKTEEE
jgi:hypothetical protein